jgi:hypothetical protein
LDREEAMALLAKLQAVAHQLRSLRDGLQRLLADDSFLKDIAPY